MREGDDHYYLTGYSVSDDPYAQPNGVLINNLGLTTTAELNEAESEFALIRLAMLTESPVIGHFDLAHLQAIHLFIFQDVYPWAGQIRCVNIGKNDTQFLSHERIEQEAASIHQELHAEQLLIGLGIKDFSTRAAYYLSRINRVHPFREGNGRVARLLALLMGLQVGLPPLDFSPIDGANKDAYIVGIHAALGRNYVPLTAMFERVISQTWTQHAASSAR